jgi:DNA-binding NtrC family response regulator
MAHILFIDDDLNAHNTLNMILGEQYKISSAYTGKQGRERIKKLSPDLIILDISLPDIDGISLLKELEIKQPVIILTAHNKVNLAVEAVKSGASDFITKPYTLEIIKKAIENSFIDCNVFKKNYHTGSYTSLDKIIGESTCIKQLKELILLFGKRKESVLIRGESGTGKELAAKALHEISGIKKELVSINCSSVPVQLFESEFFGSVKGAYTDAVDREGILKLADKSSLFLDEIGDMPLFTQAKLLRVMEDKNVKRLGSNHHIPVDFRLISATHKDLKTMIAEETFRYDLYYRINTLEINIPPLRERKEDISILAAYLLKKNNSVKKSIKQSALDKLRSHSWPGNIRELTNIIKRADIYSEERDIEAKDIIIC